MTVSDLVVETTPASTVADVVDIALPEPNAPRAFHVHASAGQALAKHAQRSAVVQRQGAAGAFRGTATV